MSELIMQIRRTAGLWEQFFGGPGILQSLPKITGSAFKLLLSTKPKQVWQVIHRILHPSPQLLTVDPDKLNVYFVSTTEQVTGTTAKPVEALLKLIDSFPEESDNSFQL